MKKLLALILSVIMILSVMPTAFATEKSVIDVYIEECMKFGVYYTSVYDPSSINEYIFKLMGENVFDLNRDAIEEKQEDVLTEDIIKLKHLNAQIEEKLANDEVDILIDTSAYVEAVILLNSYYYYDDIEEVFCNVINEEIYKEMNESQAESERILEQGGTQAEFDAAVEKFYKIQMATINHIENAHNYATYVNLGEGTHKADCWFCGKIEISSHTFDEYISNNDATEETDGTKTATCELCGATDTVIDEGSKLVKEPASFFEMLIAMIKAFFEKFFSIFG